jgi:hypothetical protein
MKNRNRDIRLGVVAAFACAGLGLGLGVVPSARAQVKLEVKYPPGRVLKQMTTTKTHQILTLDGMPIETEGDQTVVNVESIEPARDDATIPVTTKVDSLKVDLSLPGGLSVNFDSAQPDAKIEPPQLAFLGDVFKLISQVRFTVVLDKARAFKSVEGTEAIREQAEKLSEPAKGSIMSRLSFDRIKADFVQTQAKIPDVLVRPGETWERTETHELGGGQTLTFRVKYEYQGTEKKGDKTLDKIGATSTEVKYAQDPGVATPLKAAESDLKIDSSTGTILFDREGGYIASDRSKTRIKGKIDFLAGDRKLPGVLDLTIESEAATAPAAK